MKTIKINIKGNGSTEAIATELKSIAKTLTSTNFDSHLLWETAALEVEVIIDRPIITEDEPMRETDFYKWLRASKDNGQNVERFVSSIIKYLGEDITEIRKGVRTDIQNHKYVFEHFWYNEARTK